MDIKGDYTDRHGKPLRVGTTVVVVPSYDYPGPVDRVGVIIALPKEGNDLYSFPRVRFIEDGTAHYIPDSALIQTGADPDSLVGRLEATLEAVQASNAAQRALLEKLETLTPNEQGQYTGVQAAALLVTEGFDRADVEAVIDSLINAGLELGQPDQGTLISNAEVGVLRDQLLSARHDAG